MLADVNSANRVQRLIDEASTSAGNQNRLAKLIGYTRTEVTQWRTGKRPCPAEAQALMAELAGINPLEVLAYATIEKHANTPKGERLLTVLGKTFPSATAITKALACMCVSVGLAFSPQPSHAVTSYDV